jgi:hypothetical protein
MGYHGITVLENRGSIGLSWSYSHRIGEALGYHGNKGRRRIGRRMYYQGNMHGLRIGEAVVYHSKAGCYRMGGGGWGAMGYTGL